MADLIWQFRHDVLRDVQARLIAGPPAQSRVVAVAAPPLRLKAHWSGPSVTADGGGVVLSADVFGGIRETVSGVIHAVRGQVSARCGLAAQLREGWPVAVAVRPPLAEVDLAEVDLAGVDLGHEGLRSPGIEALLRSAFLDGLLVPVADLPLTYVPRHVAQAVSGGSDAGGSGFAASIADCGPSGWSGSAGACGSAGWAGSADASGASGSAGVVGASGASGRSGWIAVAGEGTISLVYPSEDGPLERYVSSDAEVRQQVPDSAALSRMLDDLYRAGDLGSPANAAVAISVPLLNAVLERLRRDGSARGAAVVNGRRCHWRWLSVQAELTPDGIRLTGWLCCDGDVGRKQVEILCRYESGSLVGNATTTGCAAVATDAATGLLRRVFCEPDGPLAEAFHIPGTDLTVRAPLVDLIPLDGLLVARYNIPLWSVSVPREIESAPPQPVVTQPLIPRQSAPGTPVTVHLIATLPHAPEPPYEFVWRTDVVSEEPQRGVSISLTVLPTDPARRVRLTVIDMLGRAGTAEADVAYIAFS